MPAPALRVPVVLDMEAFRKQAKQVSDGVGETLKIAARAFKEVNGEMLGIAAATSSGTALAWSQSAAAMALRFSLMATAGIAGFKLLSGAIAQSRQDLQDMIDIAERSRNSAVTAVFYQSFLAESKKLQVGTDELKAALDRAFDATKMQLNEGWLQGDATKEKVSDIAKAVKELAFELFTVDRQSNGAQIFNAATSQEQRIRGVLILMTELETMGEKAVALNLGERLFGPQVADRMRQGRLSAQGMLDSIDHAAAKSENIFPDYLARRAKELDDQLKIAQQRLDANLKPSFETISSIVLEIRGLWVSIVNLMADAVGLANKVRTSSSSVAGVPAALIDKQTLLGNRLQDKGLTAQQRSGVEAQLRDVQAEIAKIELASGKIDLVAIDPGKPTGGAPGTPLPRARPSDAPGPVENKNKDQRDTFDRSADTVEKRTAALEAEARTIDLNTQARERAKIVAELETVAKQTNAAAGLGENVITAEQTQRINEVADAYGRAALAIEQARSPLATFARESQNVSKALNQFAATSLETVTGGLADIVTGTKSASEAFKNMANAIISDLARIAIRQAITGPIAAALGGEGGIFSTIFGGARAMGGPVEAGKAYLVNENTPNSELFVPGTSGTIVPRGPSIMPNNVSGRGGGGDTIQISLTNNIDATGADQATVVRIGKGLQELKDSLPKQIGAVVKTQRVRGTRW